MSKDNSVLKFVIRHKAEHNGNSPSYEEIMSACGIKSKSHVGVILDRLEASGLLESEGTRSIKIPNSRWTYEEAG